MNNKVIQSVHIYILLIMSTGFMLHVLILPSILSSSHRDSWLTVISSIIPFLIWSFLLYFVYQKMNNEDLLSILYKVLKKPFYYLFAGIFIIYFLFTAYISLKTTFYWANTNYTQEVPDFFVVFLFTFICFYASYKGIRTISSIAWVILPIVVFFGFLVGIGNTHNKNYELLFPIFENGYKDYLQGFLYTCSGFFEILFILFLTPFLSDQLKKKWLFIVSCVLLMLILGPLIGAITEFGASEAEKLRNPAYEQWRILTLGLHITRLDFLSIFQWISGTFIRISLSGFIANSILNHTGTKKWSLPMLYLFIMVGAMIPWGGTSFFYFLHHYYFLINLIFLCITMVFLLIIMTVKGETS
ncbi:GerAB/ArcD/ProY family transporter [Gottfriedia solisilvae]|uniref:Spore germination protein (Amino acid permease) n=1 Tax=Gottfriedia solisilvae TaxID=1516104 RepID=A0A8J3ARM8_9BACI|nr:endospore germination permease [Gottfriedia solisilvae]GGI15647.1 hypothetical protein GCM10007380_29030 [Gottfriedia solisilvae]